MMKRFAPLILIGLLFCHCTGQEPELTLWIGGAPQEVDYWERLIQDFTETYGYPVRLVRQPTDSDQRRQELVISLESNQPDPDVFLMDVIWIGQFARSGWLEPLDSYIRENEFSTKPFFQGIVTLVDRYNGQLFALPVYVDGGLLYYRSDLLQNHGYLNPPRTWKQLVDYAMSIQEAERKETPNFNGFIWQGAQYEGLVCTFLEFITSHGGGMMVDHAMRLDTPENARALQFMQDLIHRYQISPPNTYTEMKEEEVRSSFQRGNALFERNWPYAWKLHQAEDSPVQNRVGIAPLPHFENGKSASTLGGWHAGISRYSDQKEAAWDLVQFIMSYETQKKLVLNLGWNPGRRDIYADPDVIRALPHLQGLREVFEYAVARPNLPYYVQISEVVQRHANHCLAGKIDPEKALSNMQREIERITGIYEEK
jgi:multiple sugar transport system substrate-binding protein